MKRPMELVELACRRVAYAKAVLGPVEIHGHSESRRAGVRCSGSSQKPFRSPGSPGLGMFRIGCARRRSRFAPRLRRCPSRGFTLALTRSTKRSRLSVGCAPCWRAGLLRRRSRLQRQARPISTTTYWPWSREAIFPVHFVHGTNALTQRDGQTAAALAETLVKGISQESVRRLFALLQVSSPSLRDLPPEWMRILPVDGRARGASAVVQKDCRPRRRSARSSCAASRSRSGGVHSTTARRKRFP